MRVELDATAYADVWHCALPTRLIDRLFMAVKYLRDGNQFDIPLRLRSCSVMVIDSPLNRDQGRCPDNSVWGQYSRCRDEQENAVEVVVQQS